jgi:hypothetical protein
MVAGRDGPRKKQSLMHLKCKACGAAIIGIKMPNKGAVYYDAIEGLRRVKHRCNTIGNGLSKKRDDQTPDLFETPDGTLSSGDEPQDDPRPSPG